MSAKVVRDAFRVAWATKVPTITLHETLNKRPAAPTGTWATVDFSGTPENATISGKADERGQIAIAVLAPAGAGDGAAACDQLGPRSRRRRLLPGHWLASYL
jgi:hypothetical protein